MKIVKTLIALILLATSITSCQKVVELKVAEPDPQVAVEGVITNTAGESYIKLQWTKTYFSTEAPDAVREALVTIADDEGNIVVFSEILPGLYKGPASFTGFIGRTYHLEIEYDGGTLQATSTLQDTVRVLGLELVKARAGDLQWEEGYHLIGTMANQPSIKNYFRTEAMINGKRQLSTASDLVVFDDQAFGQGLTASGVIAYWDEEDETKPQVGDTLSIRLYSLDESSYNFYLALADTPMQGGLFGKTPANVPSNIKGGIGLFQACAYTLSGDVVVTE
jgi:hypothetical protein